MRISWYRRMAVLSTGVATLVLCSLNGQDVPPAPPPQDKELLAKPQAQPGGEVEPGIEVQDSGVVHEGFAQPGAGVKGPGLLAPKAPPPAVPELPPEAKPAGDNVIWVPGYWHWDSPKKDFIWISGFWRNAPDGREWQPGEWVKEGSGYRYVSGLWKRQNAANFQRNLPKPPDPVENGPSTPAPNKDSVWVPGHWEHRNSRGYAWRGGYWGEAESGVLWTPPQYHWTPSGYTYNSGYWDYCLEDRGLLYAPVYFTRPLWLDPGWCYRPSFAINVGFGNGWGWGWGNFYSSLFIGPGYGNFYFGSRYCNWWNWGLGYRPWCHGGRGYHNHLYNHYCHLNRGNRNWSNNVRSTFARQAVDGTRGGIVATNNTRVGGTVVGGRDALARRGGAVTQPTVTPATTRNANNLVQPAKQVLASQQAARRVQVTPGGVSRTPGLNVTRPDRDVTSRLASGQGRGTNLSSNDVLRNRAGDLTRTQPLRGNVEGRTALPGQGNLGRAGDMPRTQPLRGNVEGRTTLPGQGNLGRTLDRSELPPTRNMAPSRDIDRGARNFNPPAMGRGGIERSIPNTRPSFSPPSVGRGSAGISGGSRSFNPPSSGGRGSMGGGIGGGGIGGGRSGGGSMGGSRGGKR